MADLFRTLALFFLTPQCYDQFFFNFNFFHGECIRSTLSKVLGLAVIAGSVTVKIPQILKIYNNRSGEGISLTGTLLELVAVTSFFSYSYVKQFPFSAWGDGLFMAFQTAVIVCLIFYYKNQRSQLTAFVSVYSIIVLSILLKIIPLTFLWYMQILNVPIAALGKGVQAVTNFRNKSTGQLSAATFIMQFAGGLARVFTSLQDTGDSAIIVTFVVASILNGIIVFQLFYYGKPSKKSKKKTKAKEKKSD